MNGPGCVNSAAPAFQAAAVPSPLQCPAPDYHSSFSRAVEIRYPGRRHLNLDRP